MEKFAEQCQESQRGKPLSNPAKAQEEGASICEKKRKKDGRIIYYRISENEKNNASGKHIVPKALKRLKRKYGNIRTSGGVLSPKDWYIKEYGDYRTQEKQEELRERDGLPDFVFAYDNARKKLVGNFPGVSIGEIFHGLSLPDSVRGSIIWESDNVVLVKSASPNGVCERRIYLREKRIEHSYISLDKDSQGAGIMKKFLKKSVDLYEKMGIKEIELHANLDIGGYTWARIGFDAEPVYLAKWKKYLVKISPNMPESVSSQISKCKTMNDIANLSITKEEFNKIGKIGKRGIRYAEKNKCIRGDLVQIGKMMLLGSDWLGYMHIDQNSKGWKILKGYVGKEPQ